MRIRQLLCVLILSLGAGGAVEAQTTPKAQETPPPADGTVALTGEASVVVPSDLVEAVNPDNRFWVRGDYLLWWLQGDRLPPLVTASPPGTAAATAGVLGQPGTAILFGDQRVNEDPRSGWRVATGYWLDDAHACGVEGYFFMLESRSQTFSATGAGDSNLERPFFNTTLGRQDAQQVAFPGVLAGTVTASAGSQNLLGAGLLLHCNLIDRAGPAGSFRLDAVGGFRYLHLDEGLGIEEFLKATNPASAVALGTLITVNDGFGTRNDFYGGDLGLEAQYRLGRFSLNVLGKLALGSTQEEVNISGFTAVLTPAGSSSVMPGGLLALSSNIGRHEDSHFSLVPELNVTVGYQVTERVRVTAGYSFLYWTDVVRPGRQIDLDVNQTLIPPAMPSGSPRPAFDFNRSGLWAQGINVGLEFRF